MESNNNDSQIKKGILEIPILLVLSTPKYVAEILKILESQDLFVVEGTIYPILSRLIKSEYLEYYWQESNSGPPRKYFKITPLGTQYLSDNLTSLKKLYTTIQNLKKSHN